MDQRFLVGVRFDRRSTEYYLGIPAARPDDARFDIQYDHVIPLVLGGANTAENLQILCAPCNQAKGAAL